MKTRFSYKKQIWEATFNGKRWPTLLQLFNIFQLQITNLQFVEEFNHLFQNNQHKSNAGLG